MILLLYASKKGRKFVTDLSVSNGTHDTRVTTPKQRLDRRDLEVCVFFIFRFSHVRKWVVTVLRGPWTPPLVPALQQYILVITIIYSPRLGWKKYSSLRCGRNPSAYEFTHRAAGVQLLRRVKSRLYSLLYQYFVVRKRVKNCYWRSVSFSPRLLQQQEESVIVFEKFRLDFSRVQKNNTHAPAAGGAEKKWVFSFLCTYVTLSYPFVTINFSRSFITCFEYTALVRHTCTRIIIRIRRRPAKNKTATRACSIVNAFIMKLSRYTLGYTVTCSRRRR